MHLQVLEDTAQRHRWTVTEYLKLVDAGIFAEDDRIELIDGELIDMAPIGDEHAGQVNRLSNDLAHLLYRKVVVATQNPIALSEHSEPQPDLALLRWRDDYYSSKRPAPDDVLLIIEIADTTLRYDREVKVPLYARFNIPEVWLIDLRRQQLSIYRQPADGAYQDIEHHREGRIAPANLPEAVVDLTKVFAR